jgi:signal transduction histidine kinase
VQLELRGPLFGSWDPTRVEQIVVNLVTNALKYGEGKPVTVSLDVDPNDAGRASLVVADQGCGIGASEIDSIFEKFRRGQASHHRRGLGLGLFVVRELVRAMEGEISVSSTVGVGSTFRVSLPGRERIG